MRLFTYGYLGGTLADLEAYGAAGAVILDTRLVPFSRNPLFRKAHLERALAGAYVWEQALGNLNYKNGGPVQIKDWDTGWSTLRPLLDRGPVVLLCACRDAASCHRSTIAAETLKVRPNLEVVDLRPGDRMESSAAAG